MKTALLLTIVALGLATDFNLIEGTKTPKGGGTAINLSFVVNVEGKAFFVDIANSRTWQEALEYCQSLGMRLASVTSDLQLYALNQVETTEEFPNIAGYWTSGREFLSISHYKWNDAEDTLRDFPFIIPENIGPQTCIAFAKSNNESYFYPQTCSEEVAGTMCDTGKTIYSAKP